MKIKTNLVASKFNGRHTFDTSDFDLSDEEWNELPYSQKREYIKQALSELSDQPYWTVESFDEL